MQPGSSESSNTPLSISRFRLYFWLLNFSPIDRICSRAIGEKKILFFFASALGSKDEEQRSNGNKANDAHKSGKVKRGRQQKRQSQSKTHPSSSDDE
jgi:hypothetical protein